MRALLSISVLLVMLLCGASAAAMSESPASRGDADELTMAIARLVNDEARPLQAFYALRHYRPAWQQEQTLAAFVEALQTLEDDGLNPQDYRAEALLTEYRQLPMGESRADAEARARFDLHASGVLLTALKHLQRGKVDPLILDGGWEVSRSASHPEMAGVAAAVDARRFEQAFAAARPAHAPYERLRQGLVRYRHIERLGGWPTLPARSGVLRPGDVHDEVMLLRERLAIIGELEVMAALGAVEPRHYDTGLEAAVRRFQRRHLLEVDGIVGPETRAALNVPVARRIDQIRVNLERARWLLNGLPDSFVLVDIAGYQLSYFRPNGEVWRSRIVVGRPYRRTPSLRSEITHMTVNPSWTIPPTILREDVLPAVRESLGYLWQERIQVLSPSGTPLSPWEIDWDNPGNIVLRQAPGPHNALGRVAIRFPNDHLVYLHDTPAQGLFAREQRAFSSGCIRVQDVMEFAQLLFDDTGTGRDIQAQVATGQTRNVSLADPIPLILHYWTVHPGEDGELAFRPDIYQRDEALLEALDRPLSI
jgi:L,D-transpeptidase YcbB